MPKITATTTPLSAPGAVAPKTAVDPLSLFTPSQEAVLRNYSMTLHGPPGVGKTFTALSASEYWPDVWPPKQPVELEDIVHFGIDKGSLDGLSEWGVTVSKHFDLHHYMANNPSQKITQVVNTMLEAAKAAVAAGAKTIIWDTVSELNDAVLAHFASMDFRDNRGNPDTFRLYRCVLEFHRKFHRECMKLNANTIFACHSKLEHDSNSAETKKKNRAKGTPEGGEILPAITGQGLDVYMRNVSLLAAQFVRIEPGSKAMHRELHLSGGLGFVTKNRWQRFLQPVEEPNLNKMFARLKKCLEASVRGEQL